MDESKLVIYDIETLKECFVYGDKKLGIDGYNIFVVSAWENQLDALVKYLRETEVSRACGFNNIMFDSQVIQYILDNHEKWYDLSNLEVTGRIYDFVQTLIDNQNYGILPPYKEYYLDIPQLDLFQILGYENKNLRTSLKWIEFSLNMIVEEMPIHHGQQGLTQEDIRMVVDYWKNDIHATEALYNLVRGNTDNELYKGKDKIQERLDTIESMGLKPEALNWSDVRIGETINLAGYMEETGLHMKDLYERKKKRKYRDFTFGDCMPKYIKFQTPEFQAFHKHVAKQPFKFHAKPAQEFILTYNQTTYSIMKGGIHSHDGKRILQATEDIIIKDADVGSQYPNSINKRGLYPSHLGPEWNRNFGRLIKKRMEAKDLGKTDIRMKGVAESLKLSLNGGGFGKLNDTFSVQYDPFPHFSCNIGNQFEILMLIEAMEVAGIPVVSANTDGIVCMFHKELEPRYFEICKWWEETVGNTEMGQLEYTDYSKLVQTSVNDYIAITTDGKRKYKGDFEKDKLMHKNKSNRIIPIALEAWYMDGIPVEETINNHRCIYDFCSAKKSSSDYYFQGIDRKTGETQTYNKLVRYYCATAGEKIYKIKHENSSKTGPARSQVESTSAHQILYNTPFEVENWEDYKVDTEHYIRLVKKIIHQIEPEMKRADTITAKKQIELF